MIGRRGHRHRVRHHRDAPGRCPAAAPPYSTAHRRCVFFPFLFCCLLIDRVAAVRSVDFAAEEGVVAPPGGAPGTPAGCCWLLDVSLWRVARSGWTFSDQEDDHDDLRDVQALRSRSYVPFLPFSFLFLCSPPGAEGRRPSGGAGAEMCRGVGWGRSLSALAPSRTAALTRHLRKWSICGGEARNGWVGQQINAVSYTHLTLPTILLV